MTDEGKLEYPNKAYFPNPMGLLCGVGGGGEIFKAETVVDGKSYFGQSQTALENAATLVAVD